MLPDASVPWWIIAFQPSPCRVHLFFINWREASIHFTVASLFGEPQLIVALCVRLQVQHNPGAVQGIAALEEVADPAAYTVRGERWGVLNLNP